MGNGSAPGSLIRNILFVKTGRYVSKENISYIKQTAQQLQNDNDEADSNNLSPFDSIMKKCEKQQFDYMALFQYPLIESDPINSIYFTEDNSHSVTSITDLSPEEHESLSNFVCTGRRAQNLALTQKYVIALAWVLPKEQQLFNIVPEVITVDTVH